MKAYSLKISLPRFAYFINLEILPVTSKLHVRRQNIDDAVDTAYHNAPVSQQHDHLLDFTDMFQTRM